MIAEGIERRRWNGIDGVRPDQFLDVKHVPIIRILGAGARPQHALGLRALGGQRLPARRRKDALVGFVGQLAVRDRDFPLNPLQLRLAGGVRFFLQLVANQRVDQRIDATDEKAGDAGNLAHIAAGRGEFLNPVNESRGDFLVHFLRKQQCHVDVDALADELAKRGYALGGAWHLDHHVFAGHALPQPPRLGDGAVGIEREIGRDFEAHVAVALLRALVHGREQVGRVLNIADGQQFIAAFGVEVGAAGERVQKILVLRRARDGLLENRGIGSHPAQAVFRDQALQFAALQQVAADVVEPDGLAESLKLGERIRGFCNLERAYWIHNHLLTELRQQITA